ncbi:MAG TPA: FGGY family carbohydrate kinase [Solirubrobacteraceae bacterium]|nr:FGGY family carbohydrate kinase [Solirubrobacteraceae bacterium]
MNVLAIDQGTSATKALIVGGGGHILASASVPVSVSLAPGGSAECDARELLDSIVRSGRAALDQCAEPVDAVGIANQGETVVSFDPASGEPTGPALSWQDRRAASVTAALAPHAARLTELTGLPLDPYFSAPKMALLAERPGRVGPIDAWLNEQLTGQYVTDVATASRTLLLDLHSRDWSPEACDLFGVDPGALPRIATCAERVGETEAFGPRLPVTGLAVDQQAALFAEGCLHEGESKCTYGTGAFLLANAGSQPPRSSHGLSVSVAWSAAGATSYCVDGQVYAAGAALDWLARIGLIDGAADIDALCGTEAPSAREPCFVPALAGLGAPWWAPAATASWTDLTLASDRPSLVRAVVWGIAAHVALLARALADDVGEISALRVDGGLVRSRSLMQAQADLAQMPLEVYPSPDATALGVAAFARLGAGGETDARAAIGTWSPALRYEPRLDGGRAEEILARVGTQTEVAAG